MPLPGTAVAWRQGLLLALAREVGAECLQILIADLGRTHRRHDAAGATRTTSAVHSGVRSVRSSSTAGFTPLYLSSRATVPGIGGREYKPLPLPFGFRIRPVTDNNAVSALRRAFAFGFKDHPEARDPATLSRSARIGKQDRPHLDPSVFRMWRL